MDRNEDSRSGSSRAKRAPLPPYPFDLRVLGCPHDPHYAYIVQNLVHVSDVCEAGQRGDLSVRERAGLVIILQSSRNDNDTLAKHDSELR